MTHADIVSVKDLLRHVGIEEEKAVQIAANLALDNVGFKTLEDLRVASDSDLEKAGVGVVVHRRKIAEYFKAIQVYQTADSEILEFWRALKDTKVDENDVLALGDANFFGDPLWGTKVFVRRAYVELADILFEQTRNGITRSVIVGNPGTGKSMFLFFLLKLLLDQNKTVVYHRHTLDYWYLFTPNGVKQGSKLQDTLPPELKNPNTWYLVDSILPSQHLARTVLVTSPCPSTYREFMKNGAKIRYMPVWQDTEIFHCRKFIYSHLDEEETKARYARWGGIPRYVLQFTEPEDQRQLQEAIEGASINTHQDFKY
eukprot:Phypoly_transcript_04051.p1 GENE.Phypoly_transcript_04051~~Phypoly_transcript_04051.p1  ORF type:complete len:314 (+),score=33.58 Phypoly_transcript_04051:88-1029(+)